MPKRSLTVMEVADKPTKKSAKKTASIPVTKKSPAATSPNPALASPVEPKPKTKKVRVKSAAKKTTAKKKVTKKATKKAATKKSKGSDKEVKREPLGHLLIEKLLREAGFRGGISTDKKYLDRYSTDESVFSIRPQVIIQPLNQRDVMIAVKVIADKTEQFPSLSLTARAAGTGLSGGSLTDSIVIDVCAHMKTIGPVVTKKGVAMFSTEPGAMWRTIDKKLKSHHVYLPSYPASKDLCSIGGAIANNSAGPDSLRFGSCADWVESLEVVLRDGKAYTIEPMTYREYQALIKQDNAYARIAEETFKLLEKHYKAIMAAKPETKKNTAGYALWDVLSVSPTSFKRGKGLLDLTRLISGSQGTIGIITNITMRTEPIRTDTELLAVSVFDIQHLPDTIIKALAYNPINVEVFDAMTFDLALKNPSFFKARLPGLMYYKGLLSMYTTYHLRYARKIPELTLLITVESKELKKHPIASILKDLNVRGVKAKHIVNDVEREMLWQIRRSSYTLSKFLDKGKRPAAFLEDMTVPPKNLAKFFAEISKLLKEYKVLAALHGHGGNGHFHFYPLLDFTQKTTGRLIQKMSEEFFNVAVKYDGSLCGEHNDGIIRTPYLNKQFDQATLDLFAQLEYIFDPDDIFNPGKKVNPRFDILKNIRTTN